MVLFFHIEQGNNPKYKNERKIKMKEIAVFCKTCGKGFILTGKQEEWYRSQGWENPKRCQDCRRMRRENPHRFKCSGSAPTTGFSFYAELMQSGVIMKRSTKLNTDEFRGYMNYRKNIVL